VPRQRVDVLARGVPGHLHAFANPLTRINYELLPILDRDKEIQAPVVMRTLRVGARQKKKLNLRVTKQSSSMV
jgi:hypothetical protein